MSRWKQIAEKDPSDLDQDDLRFILDRDPSRLPQGVRVPKNLQQGTVPAPPPLSDTPAIGDVGTIPDNPVNLANPDAPVGQFVTDNLEDMTKAELQDEAASRGLPTNGTKAELLKTIQDFDSKTP